MTGNGDASTYAADLEDHNERAILIDAGLFTRDPREYPGLAARMLPASGLDPHFRAIPYDTDQTIGTRVRCSICKQQQLHSKGTIVRVQSGEVGLVGNKCGDTHFFGENGWKDLERRIDIAQRQAIFDHRWKPVKAALNQVIPLIDIYKREMRFIEEWSAEFSEQLPYLFEAVAEDSQGGFLQIERKIEKIVDLPNGDVRKIREHVLETVCQIDAIWFFRGATPLKAVRDARARLAIIEPLIQADMDSAAATATATELRTLRRNIEDAHRTAKEIQQFTNGTFLNQLAKWARLNHVPPANYRFKAGKLKCSDSDFDYGAFSLRSIPPAANLAYLELIAHWPRL